MSEENEQVETVTAEQTDQKTNEQLVAEAVNGEQETPPDRDWETIFDG